jgi:hypothetical protein
MTEIYDKHICIMHRNMIRQMLPYEQHVRTVAVATWRTLRNSELADWRIFTACSYED